jgi:hypothetical protein
VGFGRASLRPEGSKTCSLAVGVGSAGVLTTTPLLYNSSAKRQARSAMKRRTWAVQPSNNPTGFSLPLSTLPGVVNVCKMRSWAAQCSTWSGCSETARTRLPETV